MERPLSTKANALNTLSSLQVLRGFAASLVVFHHAARAFTANWPADAVHPSFRIFSYERIVGAGAIGVDVFFLISGFIMVFVSTPYVNHEKPARDFIIRRAIRVYPMYAIATAAVIAIAFIRFYRHSSIDTLPPIALTRIIAAFTFVPTFDENGNVQPILGVGWTLFYEMFFYVCFATVVAIFGRRIVAPLAVIFCSAIAIAWMLGGQDAISRFFGNTIVFEFLFGCAIGGLFQRQAISSAYAWPLLFIGLALMLAGSAFAFPESTRFIFWGIPSMILLLSCLKLELANIKCPRLLLLLGDASYSVYLVHVLIIYESRDIARKITDLSKLPGDLAVLLFACLAIVCGTIVYRLVEAPLNSFLLKLYRGQQRQSQAHSVPATETERVVPVSLPD
jgi:exopolysaccharide production protein ExoZ